MEKKNSTRGFIRLIILIVIGLIILGYFGLNIKDILASPVVKENLAYAWEMAQHIWNTWLAAPAHWVFEHIIKFLWELIVNGLAGMKDGNGAAELMQQ